MSIYTSNYTGAQIDAGINDSLIYTDYSTALSGSSGTITNANLASAIGNHRPIQLSFTLLQGEGGTVICRFVNDTMSGIYYACIDTAGNNAIILFDISGSTVSWTLTTSLGVPYSTTVPVANNTDGNLKFVVLSSEPATYYTGYYYIITGA